MRLSVPLVASLAMLAFALILTPGCGPSDKIQTYTVPKEQEPEPKAASEPEKKGPYRLLGAIIPDEPGYSRFVKFLGPASKIDPYEKEFDEFLSSIRPSADPAKPFEFKAPANAQPGSPSQMRLATFLFGTDKEPAELYISNPFGGTLLENVNRWLDDVGAPNVKQEELNGVVKEFQIGTVKAYRVDFKGPGRKKGTVMGPMQRK